MIAGRASHSEYGGGPGDNSRTPTGELRERTVGESAKILRKAGLELKTGRRTGTTTLTTDEQILLPSVSQQVKS